MSEGIIVLITLTGWSIYVFRTKCKWYGRPLQAIGVLIYSYLTLLVYFNYLQDPLKTLWANLSTPYHFAIPVEVTIKYDTSNSTR